MDVIVAAQDFVIDEASDDTSVSARLTFDNGQVSIDANIIGGPSAHAASTAFLGSGDAFDFAYFGEESIPAVRGVRHRERRRRHAAGCPSICHRHRRRSRLTGASFPIGYIGAYPEPPGNRCPKSTTFHSSIRVGDNSVVGLRNSEEHARPRAGSSRDTIRSSVAVSSARVWQTSRTRRIWLRRLTCGCCARPNARLIHDPVAYVLRIARNLLHEWYTSTPPSRVTLEEVELADEGMSAEDWTEISQQMKRLEDVLRHLSPKCRAAILMHRRDGMTYDEIARTLGISSSMVKKHLSQGLARCRSRLRGFDEQ